MLPEDTDPPSAADIPAPVVQAAVALLRAEGSKGLTARRLAGALGISTKLIYSRWHGMPGIKRAVYAHGFDLLHEAVSAALGASPANPLRAAAAAYRGFATDEPALFAIMYGLEIGHDLPHPTDRMMAVATLDLLVSRFQEADDPLDQARGFWAAMHGVVSLEAAGWFDAAEATARLDAVAARAEHGLRAAGRAT